MAGPVKSDAGQRSIPIPEWLCEDLAGRPRPPGPVDRHDPLIVNKQGRPVNRDTFRAKVVRPALRAAGLPEDFRTYDIRHTHASLLIDDGANVLAVAQRMGHSDPSVRFGSMATCSKEYSRSSPTGSTAAGNPFPGPPNRRALRVVELRRRKAGAELSFVSGTGGHVRS